VTAPQADPDMVGDDISDTILFCAGSISSGMKLRREHPSFLAFLSSWKDGIAARHWMLFFFFVVTSTPTVDEFMMICKKECVHDIDT
jgi:hypothetical protein